jgi:hypothetical protein
MKRFRRIAMRFCKLDAMFTAVFLGACIGDYLSRLKA